MTKCWSVSKFRSICWVDGSEYKNHTTKQNFQSSTEKESRLKQKTKEKNRTRQKCMSPSDAIHWQKPKMDEILIKSKNKQQRQTEMKSNDVK